MYRQDASVDRSILVVAFNGRVYGVDRATGVRRWEGPELEASELHLEVTEGIVVVSKRGMVVLLDYASGALLTAIQVPGEVAAARATVLVAAPYVYIGADGELFCYSMRGERIWHDPFRGKGHGRIALALPGDASVSDDGGAR